MKSSKSNSKIFVPVTVGTPITRRPPYRSQRAELPHWVPTLNKDGDHNFFFITFQNELVTGLEREESVPTDRRKRAVLHNILEQSEIAHLIREFFPMVME